MIRMNAHVTLTLSPDPDVLGLLALEAARRGIPLGDLVLNAACANLGITPGRAAALTLSAAVPVSADETGVSAFIADHCDMGERYWYPSGDLYRAFIEHTGRADVSPGSFGIRVCRIRPYIRNTRKRHDGRLIHAYLGIRLRPDITER